VGAAWLLRWMRVEFVLGAHRRTQPTGLRTVRHVFVADKADYYEITDGLEQLSGTSVPR
jgi:hypothetical protein